jgi:DNA-binding SARP family transcriptional activator
VNRIMPGLVMLDKVAAPQPFGLVSLSAGRVMRFHVLGPLEVHTADGENVRLGAAKQRTLLVLLLLHANRPVALDRLAEALWPGRMPRSAAGNIRTYMSGLRQVLGLGSADRLPRLVAGPGGYRLDVEPSELDLLVFDDLAARGRHALGHGDPAGATEILGEALRLWRGQTAEDVVLDGKMAGTVAELDERRLAAEEAWIDAQLMLENDAELIARLRGLVARHPLRERLWGQLMTALYRSGRQAEALTAFQRLRRQVADELGVEPSPQLRRIQQQMLKGDPLESTSPMPPGSPRRYRCRPLSCRPPSRASPAAPLSCGGWTGCSPLVGRMTPGRR